MNKVYNQKNFAEFFKTRGLLKQATFFENPNNFKMTESPTKFGSAVKSKNKLNDKSGGMIGSTSPLKT